jgi:hypothetical protein
MRDTAKKNYMQKRHKNSYQRGRGSIGRHHRAAAVAVGDGSASSGSGRRRWATSRSHCYAPKFYMY